MLLRKDADAEVLQKRKRLSMTRVLVYVVDDVILIISLIRPTIQRVPLSNCTQTQSDSL